MTQDLVERLGDERPKVRAEAAAELVEVCRFDAAARERWAMRFLTLLHDDAPAVRGHAVVGAVVCDEGLVHVGRVLKLLEDPSPGVRLQVIHALGPLGLPEVPDALAGRLTDEDVRVRVTAASALAFAGDARGFEVLLAALDRRDTREEALHALRQLAGIVDREAMEQGVRRIFGGLFVGRFERTAAAGALAALGDAEGRAHLIARAAKKGIDRPLALELLGELQVREAEALLAAAAADRTDPLRGTALRAMAALGAPDALVRCSEVLLDEAEDPDVRCDAAEGLLLLGGLAAEGALVQARERAGDEQVRKVAASCLFLWGRPAREIRLFLPLSGDES